MVKIPEWISRWFSSTKKPKTEILDQLPKNKISTAKVDSTFSYSLGGKFDSTKGIGRTSSNSYSKSISYNQQNYDTIASGKNNNRHVHWSVVANDLKYGNEIKNRNDEFLFYRNTRLSTVENPELSFASKYRYPALVRSGFNPEFLTYISNEKQMTKHDSKLHIHVIKIFWKTNLVYIMDNQF